MKAFLSFALMLTLPVGVLRADEPSPEKLAFFEKKVRPLLTEHCYSCHSEASKKSKGGLTVDSLDALLAGGDSGPALVVGDSKKSILIEAVSYKNEDMQMPPKGKLADADIETLKKWVEMGAPWPKAEGAHTKRAVGKITAEDRAWWAFQPVKVPAIPAAKDHNFARNNTIDDFINAKIKAEGLSPAPEADRRTLIRRVTFDLTGLPPTPQDVEAFVADTAPRAYERLVESLLASPRYGERSAVFWLDLVRYADSDGYRIDDYRPEAWRYRDYVIRSFQNDKSYDRFVQEQLAGDELFPNDIDARIATGFMRHWVYEYNQRDVRTQWNIILDDITDTTGDVFLGLGMQCARCHDHKFDPILQKDYFRLRAFFAGLNPRDDLPVATATELALATEQQKVWDDKTSVIRAELDKLIAPYRKRAAESAMNKFAPDLQVVIRKPVAERTTYEHQIAELAYRQVDYEYARLEKSFKGEDKERILALQRELAKFDEFKPKPLPRAMGVTDVSTVAAPITIPKRGDTEIEPGFLTLLDDKPATITPTATSTGRRSALAKWITNPTNPLTARVLVNRLWQQHFGRGLAVNASDFGKLGEPPSHPELLDWLAHEFTTPSKNGDGDGVPAWSIKNMHRLMVTSAAYRRSAAAATFPDLASGQRIDPENKLLWRGNIRRLDVEQIRDTILNVSGELKHRNGGPGVMPSEPSRTVYLRLMRNNREPLLDVFDLPLRFQSASSRDTTTTAVQSLLLFNGSALLKRSSIFADRLHREEPSDESNRIRRAYELAYGRVPTPDEITKANKFLDEQQTHIPKQMNKSAEFIAGKLPYRDGQAAEVKISKHPGFQVSDSANFPKADFTIEAYVVTYSVSETGAVRTIAAKWSGDVKQPGWSWGITGKQSRRKPQTLALQLFGTKDDGTFGEEAIFSDHHMAVNKPYYLAAAVTLAKNGKPGKVTFFVKDVANDDEPLLSASVSHHIVGGLENKNLIVLGNRKLNGTHGFDGLMDDLRISEGSLNQAQLFYTREETSKQTFGMWAFEPKQGVLQDQSGHARHLTVTTTTTATPVDLRRSAWVDLCHVLLNSSEFFYID